MKVFFITAIEKYNQHKKEYNQLRRFLLSERHELILDWIEVVEKIGTSDRSNKMTRLLEDSTEAIKSADLIIAETTVPSFETGYLINLAVKYKKPVLSLTLDMGAETKVQDFAGIPESDYFEEYYYSSGSYENIITTFIQKYQGGITARFNIILERKQKNYLDWADRFYKQSKSELIRDLIDKKANEDIHYQRTLGNVT
jgi:uncharacterized protein (UPF0210 family)